MSMRQMLLPRHNMLCLLHGSKPCSGEDQTVVHQRCDREQHDSHGTPLTEAA